MNNTDHLSPSASEYIKKLMAENPLKIGHDEPHIYGVRVELPYEEIWIEIERETEAQVMMAIQAWFPDAINVEIESWPI